MIKKTYINDILVITDTSKKADTVSLGVWVGVGSRFEPHNLNGISHILEHMAFKGTQTRTYFDISSTIENVGGIVNAYTGRNVTAYYSKVLKEDMDVALSIIADIVQNSTMNKDELEKEKSVICQEIRMSNDIPDDYVMDMFTQTAFPDQAIGRPIAGTEEIVNSITQEDLFNYLETYYTKDRIIISASGNLNHQYFIEKCQKLFSRNFLSKGKKYAKAHYHPGESRLSKPHQQVNLVLGFKGLSVKDKNYYPLSLLSIILGGGMSSRLIQEIREKRGLAYSIYATHSSYSDTGLFYIYAGTGEHEIKELLPALCDELTTISHTINEQELERAKAQLKASILMHGENISSHAESNALNWLTHKKIISKKEKLNKINSVTIQQVSNLATSIFTTAPVLACSGPIKNVMPYEKIEERLKGC